MILWIVVVYNTWLESWFIFEILLNVDVIYGLVFESMPPTTMRGFNRYAALP